MTEMTLKPGEVKTIPARLFKTIYKAQCLKCYRIQDLKDLIRRSVAYSNDKILLCHNCGKGFFSLFERKVYLDDL